MSRNESSFSAFNEVLRRLGLGDLVESETGVCSCEHEFDDEELLVRADNCDGDLSSSPRCREAVITELVDTDVETVLVRSQGLQLMYGEPAARLLSAAGRFVDLLGDRDDRLREMALQDPLKIVEELDTRVDAISDIGIESGLVQAAEGVDEYSDIMSASVGLSVAYYFLDQSIPDDARLSDVKTLDTGSEVRIYERPDSIPFYKLDIVDTTLEADEREVLLDGYESMAEGDVDGERAASRAIEKVTEDPVDPLLTTVLTKHTRGYGILEDLFSDPAITDVYVTSPVKHNPVRVEADGKTLETNIKLTEDGAAALASRVRRTSGRAFSRAAPTVDATAELECGVDIRIAGVTSPIAESVAFAFREKADDRFTLPRLVKNGTLTPEVAGFLSIAIERNAAMMVAGTRGAGKTTLLGTLLYELSPDTRTVIIEDTPELPVDSLQSVGRDVQALRTGAGEGAEISATDALRTALRLGDGALVVGEIRGEEAQVLYEAMRVGANANAVLGTIHGDGGDDVFERVVSDLGVQESSFASTDLIVTCQSQQTAAGRKRRVARVEEVMSNGEDIWFEPLYEMGENKAQSTGRVDRGESRLIDRLTDPDEEYSQIRADVNRRARFIEQLAEDGRASPDEVATAYADRHTEQ